MLDREQVNHVARLARLELTEEEVDRMATELSKVLDHIEKIRELDLDGVLPTSHVVDVVNALRADEPQPSLPVEVALRSAPRRSRVDSAFRARARRPPDEVDRRPARPGSVASSLMTDLLELTAAAAAALVRKGEVDANELFEAYRERAAAEELNAFTWVADEPPATGGRGDAPLGGVPLAVKDLFCTEGVPSQAGSRILEGYRPPYTATVVQKLADAGAPLLAKTNQDEFAMGSSNENSGFGPVRNPWDRGRVPGGSSGGSAAAVAAGLAPWAIGTDTGGSIRQPAALCGIVGLKPTYGACSRYGMIAFASSLDQAGPLTRDVTDAALLLRHMVGKDPRDSTSLEFPEPIALPSRAGRQSSRAGFRTRRMHCPRTT